MSNPSDAFPPPQGWVHPQQSNYGPSIGLAHADTSHLRDGHVHHPQITYPSSQQSDRQARALGPFYHDDAYRLQQPTMPDAYGVQAAPHVVYPQASYTNQAPLEYSQVDAQQYQDVDTSKLPSYRTQHVGQQIPTSGDGPSINAASMSSNAIGTASTSSSTLQGIHQTSTQYPATYQQLQYPDAQAYISGGTSEPFSHHSKRHRSEDYDVEGEDDSAAPQLDPNAQSAMSAFKRACARCRQLKVRCDFKDDQDSCERCVKGSHECVIPGRKKRRPPPKREILITKIREQAAQIEELMGQLEIVQAKAAKSTQVANNLSRDLQGKASLSTPTSPSAPRSSTGSTEPDGTSSSAAGEHRYSNCEDATEWIAEAREKLEAFGTFVGLGGGSASRSFFVESDPEDSSSGPEEYSVVVRNASDYDEGGDREEQQTQSNASRQSRRKESRKKGQMIGLPTAASPFGMMATLSVKQRLRSPSVCSDKSDLGVANQNFFRATPDPEPTRLSVYGHNFPQLLKKNIITPEEAEKLFKIYFDFMNLSVSLLDPVLYTAQQVYWRSPFLFTVICAIASRYYTERPDLYPTAMEYARQEAGAAFLGGEKRVEVVQAYILLSLFPVPARRWDDDRCWIYLGQAIRMATDMNLHHPSTAKPQNEQHAREMLNRTRAWLNCFNLDRSMGSQYGKTPIIRNTDYVAVRSTTWWNSCRYNMEGFDIHICCYNEELRMMTDFLAKVYSDPRHPTGLNKALDLELLATEYDDKLEKLRMDWFAVLEKTDLNDAQNRFRIGLLKLAFSYARLVTLAFGFQHAFGKSTSDENPFLARCLRAASDVISAMVDDIGIPSQRIYVRHGPEAQTVFVTFACTFLIKLLLPKYAAYIGLDERAEIIKLVERATDFLSSPDVALDDRHCLQVYARFIKGLLSSVKDTPINSPTRDTATKSSSSSTLRSPPTSPMDGQMSMSAQNSPQHLHFAPLPHAPHMPFNHYATSAADVSQYGTRPPSAEASNALGMNTSDFFRAPLPYEIEFLQSMQYVSGSQDMMMPGFGWIGQMPPLNNYANTSPTVQ